MISINEIYLHCVEVANKFNLTHLVLPTLCSASTFAKLGLGSEIVQKEMFYLQDNKTVLRPEGTVIAHNILSKQGKLRNKSPYAAWYFCDMYRKEQPQRGRYRQFSQFGVEIYNKPESVAIGESVAIVNMLLTSLNLSEQVTFEVNNLGTLAERQAYIQDLKKFCLTLELTASQKLTLQHNPLRLLDSKDLKLQQQLQAAPSIAEYTDSKYLDQVEAICSSLGVKKIVRNSRLVRGLDYYHNLVFEWKFDQDLLGSQNTICAGGSYSLASGVSAHGFALGVERLLLICKVIPELKYDMYLANLDNSLSFVAKCVKMQQDNAGRKIYFASNIKTPLQHFKTALKKGIKSVFGVQKETIYKIYYQQLEKTISA